MAPNKQSPSVNFVFTFLGHTSNLQSINKFITFLGLKNVLSYFKQLPLNSDATFELSVHFSFGARPLPGAVGGLKISSDILLWISMLWFFQYHQLDL